MTYSEFAIEKLKDKLAELSMKNTTPRKYAGVMFEALEVIRQREAEKESIRRGIANNTEEGKDNG